MPDDPEREPSGWEIMRLMNERDRLYAERRHADRDQLASLIMSVKEAAQAATASAKEANGKAEAANEKRFDSVNEFRGQLADQATTFLTRAEFDAHHAALTKDTAEIGKRVDQMAGREKGTSDARAITIAAVGIAIGLAGVIIAVIETVVR